MVEASLSRGPDGTGYATIRDLALGHNLLAITEKPEESAQPWRIGDAILCYNGEIWNYKELRKEMRQQGIRFQTNSDTEVLAQGLYNQGPQFLHKLDGMFSIAWFNDNELLLARDQVGVKPLYYHHSDNRFAFSSSIKSLLELDIDRVLDNDAYKLYTTFGYVPGPRTLIKGIHKLYPGEVAIINQRGRDIHKYHLHGIKTTDSVFEPGYFRQAVAKTVKDCLMGRRNIGLFLSGGLDSSMILHEMSELGIKVKTFTTRFDCAGDKFNSDADVAAKAAKHYGTEHTELLVTKDGFLDNLEESVYALEEPRYNRSTAAYLMLNRVVNEHGIIVTLSGDSGDEIFTGYPRHNRVTDGWNIQQWWKITKIDNKVPYEELAPLLKWIPAGLFRRDAVNNHLFMESLAHLPEDFLIRNDRLGMYFGMEARFPFTSKEFRNYVLGIPAKRKKDKRIVKESYDGILPDYIINKFKTGWAIPADEWLKGKKFRNRFKRVFNQGYHPETDALAPNRIPVRHKAKMTALHFRLWAKKFGVRYEPTKH
jgi:asparagine synthase (glutamine-hydrolysing)